MAYTKTSSRSRAAYTILLTVAACFYSVCLVQSCDPGLFGSDCQYLCHCAGNTECSRYTGDCYSSGCDSDWFGPGCQYYISEFYTTPTLRSGFNLAWLTDNDDTTCNNFNTQPITVSLVTPHPLTWIRVVVSDAAYLNQYELSYQTSDSQSSTPCPDVRSARVDDTTLDISCPTSQVVSHVTLSGNLVRGMCSLYISGGRNVALNQTTSQSTTFDGWSAKHAVDGNPGIPDDGDSLKSTCSHTIGQTDKGGWWRVRLSESVYINRFLIYNRREPNRGGCCEHRLKGFTLDAYSSSGLGNAFVYRDSTPEPQDVYSIVPSPRINFSVAEVRIFTATKWLTICEVYIFGEVACPSGKFGSRCERNCNCAVEEACFVSSGGCPSGCVSGFTGEDCYTPCEDGRYGSGCTETCSDHCAGPSSSCNRLDGSCDNGCEPGYLPPLCTEECSPGYYGDGCRERCSEHCAGPTNACDHITGHCTEGCDAGYRYKKCGTECFSGRYGIGCQYPCNRNCKGQGDTCHHIDGACTQGCDPGYQGILCNQKCDAGKYGQDCGQTCSVHCAGEASLCRPVDGTCFDGCDVGYQMPLCIHECEAGKYGQDCGQTCSVHCAGEPDTCHHVDGTCDQGCDVGYQMPLCIHECETGKYGQDCGQTCSVHCAGEPDTCHHVDGTCDQGCDVGYQMPLCIHECETGKYGQDCGQTCSVHCAGEPDTCHHVDGTCDQGCDVGYQMPLCIHECETGKYGQDCGQTCSVHCAGEPDTCHHVDGTCDQGCDVGYQMPLCIHECETGKYGQDCGQTCSVHCAGEPDTCHHVDGTCDQGCDVGYCGLLCIHECAAGKYGQDCSQTCSEHCAGEPDTCHHVNGTCDQGCDDGYQRPLCVKECASGTYGHNCAENCSVHCAGESNSCHHVNGTCSQGCDAGYQGPLCTLVEGQQGGEEGSGAGAALPAIVGVIVAILIIAAIVAVFLVWRRRTRHDSETRTGADKEFKSDRMTYANVNAEIEQPQNGLRQIKAIVNKAREAEDGEDTDEDSDSDTTECPYTNLQTGNTAVPVGELKAYIHRHATDSHFKDQFTSIAMDIGHAQSQGLAATNIKKNRYKNIIPYDASRVLLKVDEKKNQDDYINASFVKGCKDKETFIASQGPNDLILDDFVRMLWEQKVDRVAMLTNLVELGKKKCSQYWPEDGEKWLGEITVQLLTTRVYDEYTIRHLRLCKAGEPPRDMTQFHFTAWPDKSVPDNPWGLVDFQQRVLATPASGPLLVHCSAGVGRTGTFIALCNLLREAEATGKMDFRSTLWNLRQDRMHMIQTVAQYTFLHKAALVAHTTSGTTILAKDIPARLKVLESGRPSDTSARTYQQEFDDLCAVCDEDTLMPKEDTNQSKRVPGNTRKDRVSNILPKAAYRPVLSVGSDKEDSYINAVLVPSIRQISQDVLTQLPLPSTVNDFWRMATQYRVSVILAFQTDAAHLDKTIGEFLPKSDKQPLGNERFQIGSVTMMENSAMKELSLTVQRKDVSGASNSTKQHSLTCILSKKATLEPEFLLQILEKLQASRPRETSRAVYMCRNGADYSGLACVLSILLARLEIDQCLTVPLVVGAIKAIRPQVIPTVEQYKCLYQALRLAHESKNVYGNMGEVSQK